jgi:hypothetical protein
VSCSPLQRPRWISSIRGCHEANSCRCAALKPQQPPIHIQTKSRITLFEGKKIQLKNNTISLPPALHQAISRFGRLKRIGRLFSTIEREPEFDRKPGCNSRHPISIKSVGIRPSFRGTTSLPSERCAIVSFRCSSFLLPESPSLRRRVDRSSKADEQVR